MALLAERNLALPMPAISPVPGPVKWPRPDGGSGVNRGIMVRRRVVEVESAGGVAYRYRDDGIDVVVCGIHDPRVWMLPKGTPRKGESIEEAAMREVREETGLFVRPVESLGAIEYWFARGPVRIHKRVYHFLMEPLGGDLSQHDAEFDDVQWVSAQQAEQMLSYPNEMAVLRRAIERAQARRGAA